MQVEDHRYEQALRDFVGTTEQTASEAFGQLSRRAMPMLHAYLRSRLPAVEDREDVVQEVMHRLWRSRSRFEPRGLGSWWIFVKTTADRCAIDHFRSRGAAMPLDALEMADIPETDVPTIESLVVALDDRERLYRLANELWIGTLPRDCERMLLAAKMFYLDGLDWSEICRLMGPYQPAGAPLTRMELDRWLTDPSILRLLAFESLYVSNQRLAATLLGVAEADDAELDRLRLESQRDSAETPPAGWMWAEVHAIIWRYRYTLLIDQIARLPACRLKKEELLVLFDRCRSQFPFDSIIGTLQSRINRSPSTSGVLAGAKLWHRLVFEYFASDGLPQKDIHERTSSAAGRAGYDLTLGMLNVWLSNGRLFKQLSNYLASQVEGDGAV